MEKDIREQIALARYAIISPVLAEPGRVQNAYFRSQAQRDHDLPGSGPRRLTVSTMKAWLRRYRKEGFDALKPKERSDRGRPRRLTEEMLKAIEVKAKAYPARTVQGLYEELCAQGLLGDPPVHYNTLLRAVKAHGWLPDKGGRTDMRKSFETDQVNELWICDFLHGPPVRHGTRTGKAILCAIIDDHSRLIVGHTWSASETISTLTVVLKEAFGAYGIPKRLFVDNGPAFSCELLARSCALAGISLIHSKPYDSPSRGKIERFFRTVRERFLSGLGQPGCLEELQEAFALWLQDGYHHRVHRAIAQKPIDRYQASVGRVPIRRLSKQELEEIFLVRHERVVGNDATISFKGSLYEVPAAYIRHRIEIRHPVDAPEELYLYDSGIRVGRIKLLDKKDNARTFRPRKVTTAISFAHRRVLK